MKRLTVQPVGRPPQAASVFNQHQGNRFLKRSWLSDAPFSKAQTPRFGMFSLLIPILVQKTAEKINETAQNLKKQSKRYLFKTVAQQLMQGLSGFRFASDSKGPILPPDWDMQDPDFPSRQLAGQTYQNATFHQGMIFGFNFKGSTFSPGTNFSYSLAGGADFSNCQVRAANFTKAILVGADFTETDLRGAIFDNALLALPKNMNEFLQKLSTEYGMSRPIIWLLELQEESRKKDSPGSREDLPPFSDSFKGANLVGASFKGADIRKRDFRGANLAYVDFTNAQMQGADLTGARIIGAKFDGANLDGAKINLEEAIEREQQNKDGDVMAAFLTLGRMCLSNGINLSFHEPKTARHISEILEAKKQGNVTQNELEEAFGDFLQIAKGNRINLPEVFSFIFEKMHQKFVKQSKH